VPLKLYGQELQAESYAVARMNAIIHDMDVDLRRGDTMINPKFRTSSGSLDQFDLAVANPMWNQPFDASIFEDDPYDRFTKNGGASSGKGDWAWLQHTLSVLKDGGRAAVVLDTGAVTRGSGSKNEDKERNIRKWFVDHDLVEGVIFMPDNLFYNTTAAGVIVVLNKGKPEAKKGKITLVNASKRFTKGKPKNHLADEDVVDLAKLFNAGEDVEGEVAVIDLAQAAAADYNLGPSKWVLQAAAADHVEIPQLLAQLNALAAEDADLTAELLGLLRPLAEAGAAR